MKTFPLDFQMKYKPQYLYNRQTANFINNLLRI